MNLRLVSSSDDRALAIRDHLLPLVRDRGLLECQRGSDRVIAFQLGRWLFDHWTPFNELSPEEASSPGYRHALERQHMRPDLPYELEVWRGAKVLSVLWADDVLRWAASSAVPGKMKLWCCNHIVDQEGPPRAGPRHAAS